MSATIRSETVLRILDNCAAGHAIYAWGHEPDDVPAYSALVDAGWLVRRSGQWQIPAMLASVMDAAVYRAEQRALSSRCNCHDGSTCDVSHDPALCLCAQCRAARST